MTHAVACVATRWLWCAVFKLSPRHMFSSLVLAVASEGAPRLQVCLLHPSEFLPLFAWSRVILEYEINCMLVIAAGLGPYGLVMVKKVF